MGRGIKHKDIGVELTYDEFHGETLHEGGKIIWVGENGNYSQISDAIAAASTDELIFVQKGIYNPFTLEKRGVSIVGESKRGVVISTGINQPLITINKPSGDVNFNTIKNLTVKGPGRSNTLAHGVKLNGVFEVDLDGLLIYDCRDAIHSIDARFNLHNINVQPIGEWGYGNCYRGIYHQRTTGAGLYGSWKKVYMGYLESDAIYIEKIDSLIADDVWLLESGGHGLRVDGTTCASQLSNWQVDCMHGDALHLGENAEAWKFRDTIFEGIVASGAPQNSSGHPELGIPAGLGGYALYLKNGDDVQFEGGQIGHGGKNIWIEDSYWVWLTDLFCKFHSGVTTPGTGLFDGITIKNSDATRLKDVTVSSYYSPCTGKKGIYYTGAAPNYGTRILGGIVEVFPTKYDLAADTKHERILSDAAAKLRQKMFLYNIPEWAV